MWRIRIYFISINNSSVLYKILIFIKPHLWAPVCFYTTTCVCLHSYHKSLYTSPPYHVTRIWVNCYCFQVLIHKLCSPPVYSLNLGWVGRSVLSRVCSVKSEKSVLQDYKRLITVSTLAPTFKIQDYNYILDF